MKKYYLLHEADTEEIPSRLTDLNFATETQKKGKVYTEQEFVEAFANGQIKPKEQYLRIMEEPKPDYKLIAIDVFMAEDEHEAHPTRVFFSEAEEVFITSRQLLPPRKFILTKPMNKIQEENRQEILDYVLGGMQEANDIVTTRDVFMWGKCLKEVSI